MMPVNSLLLFDIDGTLIRGRGVPRRVMLQTIRHWFPSCVNGDAVLFSGMTDPQIVRDILAHNGHYPLEDRFISMLLNDFTQRLSAEMNPHNPPELLVGVVPLLEYCSAENNCFPALVTGNIMAGARIKLAAAGILDYFPLGAFGCDSADRNDLPPIAIRRAESYYQTTFDNIWIIGDSANDVACARANGLPCLAVQTGNPPPGSLDGADHIVADLSDTHTLLRLLKIVPEEKPHAGIPTS